MDQLPSAPAPLAELTDAATGRGLPPLQHVTFSLRPGEAWLISGPNGGGKSTFLKLLRGELSPTHGTRRYVLDGQARTSAVRAMKALALVSPEQEAFYLTRDWVQTVSDVLLSGFSGDTLRLWEASPEALARLDEVAGQVGLHALLKRDFRTLSHGQRRRALLGRALMPRPQALLLDEFTDGLSMAARKELRGVLETVVAQGTALVLVTHRPEEAPKLNWRHARIEAGTLAVDTLTPAPPSRPARFELSVPAPTGPVLVQLDHAEVYRNGHHALGPVTWTWREGQHWLVTGENGSGKSTFARLVAGEFHPSLGGRVSRPFLKRDLLSERQRHIGLLGAEVAIRQRRGWTGLEVIGSAYGGTEGFAHPLTGEQRQQVEALAARLGASDLLTRPADTLSQGQLRRLLLGRALVHRPRLLILDEGLDFLDVGTRAGVLDLLGEWTRGGTHLLVIAHREEDAPPGLTHHLELDGGKVTQPLPST
ncbi:ATP-binding cassette domain-containing protein [Deinococcus rubellus]|uniref:ATP-binding cassette domain-containing protein n=1 Tax=Deinococcus rubellus TaxID=1889240 RepID=A0ABY5YJ60_9DEIO|nr:ATP-binding cassette domain-containing protein [Deinococcus rubellus]UWX64387.1 ATP-binding cassette domain-containing protein [Deinococcus rubellus]